MEQSYRTDLYLQKVTYRIQTRKARKDYLLKVWEVINHSSSLVSGSGNMFIHNCGTVGKHIQCHINTQPNHCTPLSSTTLNNSELLKQSSSWSLSVWWAGGEKTGRAKSFTLQKSALCRNIACETKPTVGYGS